MRQMPHPVSSR